MPILGMEQHTHSRNIALAEVFLHDSNLSEQDIIKFELRRGEIPIVHVTNYGFLKISPTHTQWTETIGCGGNVHRKVKVAGVEVVSVFRGAEL